MHLLGFKSKPLGVDRGEAVTSYEAIDDFEEVLDESMGEFIVVEEVEDEEVDSEMIARDSPLSGVGDLGGMVGEGEAAREREREGVLALDLRRG